MSKLVLLAAAQVDAFRTAVTVTQFVTFSRTAAMTLMKHAQVSISHCKSAAF